MFQPSTFEAPDSAPGPYFLEPAMFVLYQLEREMSGAWQRVATSDSWEGMARFIDTYYNGITNISWRESQMLPVPKNYEASFRDYHGNAYVIYELPAFYRDKYSDYPDIDEDYDNVRHVDGHLRDHYYDPDYDNYMDVEAQRLEIEDQRLEIDDLEQKLYDEKLRMYLLPARPIVCADRKNSWYLGALHGV